MRTLYIRSQDTYRLVKFDRSLSISNNNSIMDGYGNTLGSYLTTYDAVKVLDEIQKVLTTSLGEVAVYQMPPKK